MLSFSPTKDVIWTTSLISTGLSIAVLTQNPERRLLIAAAYNSAVGGLHLCLALAPAAKPQGKMNPRPQSWYYLLVIISSLISLPAILLMFLFRGLRENGNVGKQDGDIASMGCSETVAIACGCLGIVVLIWNLSQCYYIYELAYTDFPVGELQEGYAQVVQKSKRESKRFATTII
ncbi:hypothetical protein V2G26_018830 [Clonostachys chloroleuca]